MRDASLFGKRHHRKHRAIGRLSAEIQSRSIGRIDVLIAASNNLRGASRTRSLPPYDKALQAQAIFVIGRRHYAKIS